MGLAMIGRLLALALVLAPVALAQKPPESTQRRVISPIAIQGNWIGTPNTMPEDCSGDGFLIGFGTNDGKSFFMTVRNRVGGVAPGISKDTELKVVPPPEGAPARIEVFLAGGGSEFGIAIRTGGQMEMVPAGADKTYAATSLYLRRCL